MRVMWITAMPVPDTIFDERESNIKHSGGWIEATVLNLKKEDAVSAIAVISVNPSNTNEVKTEKNITIYRMNGKVYSFFRQKKIETKIREIVEIFEPEIIDIQGLEFEHSLAVCQLKLNIPVIYTIQGLPSEMTEVFLKSKYGRNSLFMRSIRDNLTGHGTAEHAMMLYLRGRHEIRILRQAQYVAGRSKWDKHFALRYNPTVTYFHIDRFLRRGFYCSEPRKPENVVPHSVFVHEIGTVLKGGDLLIQIVKRLAAVFPDVIVWIPGENIGEKEEKKRNGYEKHLIRQLKKYGLEKQFCFLGKISADEIAGYLRKSNIYLQVSLIENCSNTLAEAQMIGVPCIVSDVGGTSTYVEHRQNGLLYDIGQVGEAVKYIKYVFEDNWLDNKLSVNGRNTACIRHDRNRNVKRMIEVYRNIILETTKNKDL